MKKISFVYHMDKGLHNLARHGKMKLGCQTGQCHWVLSHKIQQGQTQTEQIKSIQAVRREFWSLK